VINQTDKTSRMPLFTSIYLGLLTIWKRKTDKGGKNRSVPFFVPFFFQFFLKLVDVPTWKPDRSFSLKNLFVSVSIET
jgi:hypothetical protein